MIKRLLKGASSLPTPDLEELGEPAGDGTDAKATPAKAAKPVKGAKGEPVTRVVEGVTVRTYRGASLAELAPRIREDLGDAAMILRQREGLTGGIAGFFAKACVEVDVAVLDVPAAKPGPKAIDTTDGPAAGPPAFVAPLVAATADEDEEAAPAPPAAPAAIPAFEPLAAPALPEAAEPAPAAEAEPEPEPEPEPGAQSEAEPARAFSVRPPSSEQAAAVQAALPQRSFEEHLQHAGLAGDPGTPAGADPVKTFDGLRSAVMRRGLPDQVIGPVAADALAHRLPLAPGAAPEALLTAELARRIPTAPLTGAPGQAIAFVGAGGAGKTRAIARLAAAYASASSIPVACVTLHGSGDDHLLAQALAPYGVPVHAAPDTPTALDRITALRRDRLVLVDTPAVSGGDEDGLRALGTVLELLELDGVALCLPVTLAAAIARRTLRTMLPLRPTALIATHADEADLLGGVVAVAIDRRVPLAYVSRGTGAGTIEAADAQRLAAAIVTPGHDATAPGTATAQAAATATSAAPAAAPVKRQPWGMERR